ncbi:MBL fold metallo-hydrolase [Spiroplasma culicicola]|uniref:Metallo-beta-lactamase domain-containing protein n=1 Tax=Spiroplasma culicicola AES-1 TaxID=1276246 RepID=W6A6X6_9MOLU|nr:MBL fold metallo-hydrolase [Spiroplasma culicicola]AHI52888.1 hypothetical protein SCULI_v1c05470 [Spiroplasma culicicola AES-1]
MIQVFSDKEFKDTNAYLIYNDDKKAILIDTANKSYKEIIDFVKRNDIIITDIFITHGHFPHFYGINEICDELNNPNVYIGQDDMMLLFDPVKNLSSLYDALGKQWAAKPIKNLNVVSNNIERVINDYKVKVLKTPGHTKGTLTLEFPEIKCLFNGDTLFLNRDVVGVSTASDNEVEILNNIKHIFESYPKGYSLFPGHYDFGFTIRDMLEKNNIIKKRYLKIIYKNDL